MFFCSKNSNDKEANSSTLPATEGTLPFKRKNRETYPIARGALRQNMPVSLMRIVLTSVRLLKAGSEITHNN